MSNERENLFQPLTFADYNIAGNVFRAYYDADKKMVFVVDYYVDDLKPNVLLVINPVGNRKWDDILMNDYGVDLETVRPKKDNKYQKLDIEYTGLAQYDALVRAYDADENLDYALTQLNAFRHDAAKRAANERLGAAELTIERAQETIEKTADTITELRDKLKKLRAKLADLRRGIGREPTKQSAAKILRTEAQIDATTEKLERAKKRMESAQQRLDNAQIEEKNARNILGALNKIGVPAMPMVADVAVVETPSVPAVRGEDTTDIIPLDEDIDNEPKAMNMADDVKPLFDEDPKILDEDIAFKPIDFGAPKVSEDITEEDNTEDDVVEEEYNTVPLVQPLSFTPPVSMTPIDEETTDFVEDIPAPVVRPVLDSISPVDSGDENNAPVEIDSELMAGWNTPVVEPEIEVPAPVVTEVATPVVPKAQEEVPVVAPVSENMPEVAVAPVDSGFRPVSPVTGDVPVPPADNAQGPQKPTLLYYVMLSVLIVLSIFALWMYQNSANDNTPELLSKTNDVAVVETVSEDVVAPAPSQVEVSQETPFIDVSEPEPVVQNAPVVVSEPVVQEVKPEPVVEEPVVAQPEPENIPITEETVMESEPVVSAPVDVSEPEPVVEETATITEGVVEPVAEPDVVVVPASEEEVLASKPEYNVSQNEKMFVADEGYVVSDSVVVVPEESNDAIYEQVVQEEFVEEDKCSDGNPPDENGCCAGENLMDVGGGVYQCCAESTGECFDPLQI